MSALVSYLSSHPLALALMVAVCATSAWLILLWATVRAELRKTSVPSSLGTERKKTSETREAIGANLSRRLRRRAMESELEKQVLQLEMQMAENSRSGLSVERSLKTCLEHSEQPIKEHLERIVNELSYSNRTLAEAFASFAERTQSQDVAILSSVISVQQETGANLADTLDFLAQTIEEKQRMRMTLRSRIAEMRLTRTMVALAPLIIVAMCCMFIEGVVDFYLTNPLGWMLLGICGSIEACGVLLLNKLSDIPID